MAGTDYSYSNHTMTTALIGTWVNVPALRSNRAAILAINQGVSNDMITSCKIEFWGDLEVPSTSDSGIMLTTGDSISADMSTLHVIYWRSTTTNASLQFVEYEKRIEL